MNKHYVGDGVYADVSKHMPEVLVLTTEDGVHTTNIIFIESEIWRNICEFVKRWKGEEWNETPIR